VHRNRFLIKRPTRRTNYPNLFCYKTLHVSGICSAHHQEFSTVHSALASFMQVSDDRFQAESGWNEVPSWLCFLSWSRNLATIHFQTPATVPRRRQQNPFHTFTSYFFKISCNRLLLSHLIISLPSRNLSFRFADCNFLFIAPLPYERCMSLTITSPRFDHINNIRQRVQTMQLLIVQFIPPSSFFPFLCPISLLTFLFSRRPG
jgi:hypothetical protein